jgi:hypothetical protein
MAICFGFVSSNIIQHQNIQENLIAEQGKKNLTLWQNVQRSVQDD